MSNKDLYSQFYEIVKTGDEDKAREFIFEHFKEFPEETQKEITFAFYEDALAKEAGAAGEEADLKSKGLDFLRDADKAKSLLEDQAKAADAKSALGI